MAWYKKSSEFVGSDASLTNETHIEDVQKRNIENQYLPPTISQGVPDREIRPDKIIHSECEKCHMALEDFERLGYFFKNQDGKQEEAYSCSNCGYKNHYTKQISRGRKNSRFRRKRRSYNAIFRIVTAAPYGSTFQGWQSGYNPANTPMGRLDLSEDQRMIPWSLVKDGFDNEWDSQKQKKNDDDWEVIKIIDEDGKIKYVKKHKKTTGGDAIQPSNVYTQRGRIKKQRRFNPKDGKGKDNPGAWPHNRNITGPGSGGYQMPYSDNMNADMRLRVVDWYDYLNNRGSYSMSRPY